MLNLDFFGANIPKLNIKGQTEIKTKVGAFYSLMIMIVTLLYAALKLQHLLEHKNPEIMVHAEKRANNHYRTSEDKFMLAVALENFYDPLSIIDETYIQWIAKYSVRGHNPSKTRISYI